MLDIMRDGLSSKTKATAAATEKRLEDGFKPRRHSAATAVFDSEPLAAATCAKVISHLACCFPVVTELVVEVALLFVVETFVRLRDLLELLFGFLVVGVYVRVILASK